MKTPSLPHPKVFKLTPAVEFQFQKSAREREVSLTILTMNGSLKSDGNASSAAEEEGEEEEEVGDMRTREPTELVTTFQLRLHAANLDRRGVWKNKLPNTYARIVTNSSVGKHHPANDTLHERRSSDASCDSYAAPGEKLGETEVITQSRNPQWTRTILLDYEYGSAFFFTVHVMQVKSKGGKSSSKSDDETRNLGSALFEVGDILGTRHATKVKRLRDGGCVFCHLEPVVANNINRTVHLQIVARNLESTAGRLRQTLFHRDPDTVLEIAKRPDDYSLQAWVTVYRSQPVLKSANPEWDVVEMNLGAFCGGTFDRHIRLSIKSVKKGHADELIGMTETTLNHLIAAVQRLSMRSLELNGSSQDNAGEGGTSDRSAGHELVLQRIMKRSHSRMEECGILKVRKAEILSPQDIGDRVLSERSNGGDLEEDIEVVDVASLRPLSATLAKRFDGYMNKSCRIDFCVAIDFTSSNGDPREENSLHYQCEDSLNDYEETITAIGEALDVYSKTKDYSVWGFGAKFGGVVRHVFQCGPTKSVNGVDGIITAYKSMFQNDLTMSGPTDFRSVLQAAAVQARKNHLSATENSVLYTVLLVITDGIMDNLQETQQKLAAYSEMPLSIVFVGVGRSDFRQMNDLCGISGRRCNTTFVEFRRHQHDPTALGEAALENVPAQLCEYMDMRGFQ
jgi:hypothetical protein